MDDAVGGNEAEAFLANLKAHLQATWPGPQLAAALGDTDLPSAEALAAAAMFPERIADQVLEAVRRAAQRDDLSDEQARLLLRGLFVLGGARYEQAWPHVLSLMASLGDALDEILGDVVTESLHRILAGLYNGDAESLEDALIDPDMELWSRAALCDTITTLAWKQRLAREDAVRMLARADRLLRETAETPFWVSWSNAVALLVLDELVPAVEQAYADGRITPDWATVEHFREDLAAARSGKDESRFETFGYIDDILAEVEKFPFFHDDFGDPSDEADDGWTYSSRSPVRNPLRNVGRNDPCPCGSGRKYKKCCLDKL